MQPKSSPWLWTQVEALQGHSGVQFCKLINLGRATAKDKLSLQMNLR